MQNGGGSRKTINIEDYFWNFKNIFRFYNLIIQKSYLCLKFVHEELCKTNVTLTALESLSCYREVSASCCVQFKSQYSDGPLTPNMSPFNTTESIHWNVMAP